MYDHSVTVKNIRKITKLFVDNNMYVYEVLPHVRHDILDTVYVVRYQHGDYTPFTQEEWAEFVFDPKRETFEILERDLDTGDIERKIRTLGLSKQLMNL